jgi:hypothetical protein
MAQLEPSTEGKSREQCVSQPVGVVVEPVAVGDAVVYTSCLKGRTRRSRRITVFGAYHGASVIILRTLGCNLSRISILEFDAVPHSCTP